MNRYQKALEPIHVTPQMRAHIVTAVTRRVLAGQAKQPIPLRRYGALAACLAVLLVGVLAVPRLTNPADPTGPTLQITNPLTEVSSLDALEAAAGFPVKAPATLPFTPEETTYTYIADGAYGIAQIDYRAGAESACWRQSLGSGDISGDYNHYDEMLTLPIQGLQVRLKGTADGFVLATWTDGTYTYALSLSSPQDEGTWQEMLSSVS